MAHQKSGRITTCCRCKALQGTREQSNCLLGCKTKIGDYNILMPIEECPKPITYKELKSYVEDKAINNIKKQRKI